MTSERAAGGIEVAGVFKAFRRGRLLTPALEAEEAITGIVLALGILRQRARLSG
jgi:hypothetical protein